jgi:hypothetical protein
MVLREGGLTRPGAATNIPLACAMWSPDADKCYQLLSTSLNILMWGTHFSLYTLNVFISFFAYRTGNAYLMQLPCCASNRTRDTALHTPRNRFCKLFLELYVFIYKRKEILVSNKKLSFNVGTANVLYITVRYDNLFRPSFQVIIQSRYYKRVRGTIHRYTEHEIYICAAGGWHLTAYFVYLY